MSDTIRDPESNIAELDDEQLPVPEHRLHGPVHFLGLYAAEHVAATEFVIGAALVAMGATIQDILLGLLIGNTLATLSFWLITAPISVKTRLSLYTYLEQNMGEMGWRSAEGFAPRIRFSTSSCSRLAPTRSTASSASKSAPTIT